MAITDWILWWPVEAVFWAVVTVAQCLFFWGMAMGHFRLTLIRPEPLVIRWRLATSTATADWMWPLEDLQSTSSWEMVTEPLFLGRPTWMVLATAKRTWWAVTLMATESWTW